MKRISLSKSKKMILNVLILKNQVHMKERTFQHLEKVSYSLLNLEGQFRMVVTSININQ